MNIANLQENIPLAPYTSFKIGGPARYFVVVNTRDELLQALQEARGAGIPWFMLGAGSDILVADQGFNGLVIKSELRGLTVDNASARVRAEAGLRFSMVITRALQCGLSGLEFAIGVPASVGGAVWANLGARGSQVADVLVETAVVDARGALRVLQNTECKFSYRDSIFKHEKFVICDALFQLKKQDKAIIQQTLQQLSELRKETQDIAAKCAGCVFRNPTEQSDKSAAELIDALGLKGTHIGGAQVSERHANFIINTGDATAEDVVMLISLVKQKVRDQKGIQLMEEIEYVGF